MGHEIYYTSAPEGVRPGQQGFCTVATTPGIPKPLWDRLESISGYRHQFSGASSGQGQNPVAWAHWLIQVSGRELSVLSRIGDAGLDYTQRTNAFAHHIALEPEERAAGGPAFMLRQGAVMASRWDGQTKQIVRPVGLPRGDAGPGSCLNWQRVAGDAGWAGVLAEAAVKNPRKPVCILFNPDQDLLPLVAEAIALVPARLRWGVTFNTYFTSLPGSATCAWRCCLANTPAANEAMRHAAGSLVLDLSEPGRLGAPAAGPWVEFARTGRGSPAGHAEPASAAAPPRQPFTRIQSPAAAAEPAIEDFLPDDAPPLDDLPALAPPVNRPGAGRVWGGVLQRKPATVPPTGTRPAAGEATGTSRVVDTSWAEQRARAKRRWLVAACGLAIAFVGLGTWLKISSDRASSDRPIEPVAAAPETQPAVALLPPEPEPAPFVPVLPPPPVSRPATVEAPVTPATQAIVEAPPPPPPVNLPPPEVIELPPLQPPTVAGAAMRNKPTQSIPIGPERFEDVRGISAFTMKFPGGRVVFALRQKDIAGELRLTQNAGRPHSYAIAWADALNPTMAKPVANVSLDLADRAKPKLDVVWDEKIVVARPDVTALARVVLQNGSMAVSDQRNDRPQQLAFARPRPVIVDVAEAEGAITVPPLPPGLVLAVARGALPAGWQAKSTSEVPTGNAAAGATVRVLTFTLPAADGRPAGGFAVRIGPDWKTYKSNFASQLNAAKAAADERTTEMNRLETDAAQLRKNAEADIRACEESIEQAKKQQALPERELKELLLSQEVLRTRIAGETEKLARLQAQLKEEVDGILRKRQDAEQARAAHAAAVAAYEQIRDVEVAAALDGVVAASIHLVRGK